MQASHAALEIGLHFGQHHTLSQTASIVLIAVKNEYQLLKAQKYVEEHGIHTEIFYEPDDNLGYPPGYTAFASEPVEVEKRSAFRRFQLWKPPMIKEIV